MVYFRICRAATSSQPNLSWGERTTEFLRTAWRNEVPTLAGKGDLREILLIDDIEMNVVGAREASLSATRWDLSRGYAELEGALAEHGALAA